MEMDSRALQERYREMGTDELVERVRSGNLTDEEQQYAETELKNRGVAVHEALHDGPEPDKLLEELNKLMAATQDLSTSGQSGSPEATHPTRPVPEARLSAWVAILGGGVLSALLIFDAAWMSAQHSSRLVASTYLVLLFALWIYMMMHQGSHAMHIHTGLAGEWPRIVELLLPIYSVAGTIAGIAFLVYLGFMVTWYAPLILVLFSLIAVLWLKGLEARTVLGRYVLLVSLAGIIGVPSTLYAMVYLVAHRLI